MKKFFSLIALVGLFAACEPEQILTAFEVNDAVATINVKVVDVLTGDDVTSVATITASKGTVANAVVTVTGDPAIQAQDITVTATYNGESASMTVPVNYILAGGKANYSIAIVVGTPVDGYEYSYNIKTSDAALAGMSINYFNKATHEYSHGGLNKWAMNPTEFLLKGEVEYDVYTGQQVKNVKPVQGFETVVGMMAPMYDMGMFVEPDVFEIVVSAYSWYTAYSVISQIKIPCEIVASKEGKTVVAGTFDIILTETEAGFEEIAIPAGHHGHGHYVQGHGHAHGHGSNANAGGGIVIGE